MRKFLICAFLIIASSLAPHAAADEAKRNYGVTFATTGPEADSVEASLMDGFVESLNARKDITANTLAKSAYWMAPPKGAGDRVSLVVVAIGEHRDILALRWDDKGTTVVSAVRRQCRVGVKGRRDWFSPGPNQIGENAVKELASDVGHAWKPAPRENPRVQVAVTGWNVTSADLTGGIDALVKEKKGAEAERPVVASGSAIDAMKALTFAAMSEVGFSATTESSPLSLQIEVAQATDHYAIRCTLTRDGKTLKYQRRFIGKNVAYEHVVTAMRKLLVWQDSVRDASYLGAGPVDPLLATKDLVVTNVGGNLRGIEPLTGKDQWMIEAPPKSSPRYQTFASATGTGIVGFVKSAERIDPATGKGAVFSELMPALPHAFDIQADRAAVMRDTSVGFYQGGKEVWKTAFAEPLACGPAIAGDKIIVGNEAGELIALSAEGGKEVWRRSMQVRVRGPITFLGERIIVGSMEGSLLAVSPKDGAIVWKHDARDLPLTRPVMLDGAIFFADKGNTLWLIDAGTGAPRASYTAPRWIRGAIVVEHGGKKWVACADMLGVIRFLNTTDLKLVRETNLSTSVTGGMIAASDFPLTWASHDDLEQKSPGLLVGAEDGWIYLIDLPH